MGMPLAALWALQAATTEVSGGWFLRLPLLFGMAAALLFWRLSSPTRRRRSAHKHGTTLGVCCAAIAATFSAALNWHASGVPMAFIAVFLTGAAIYLALSGFRFTTPDLDLAATGLALGTVVPVTATLVASLAGLGSGRFGLHQNSAAFLLIATPALLATTVDRRKRATPRIICGTALVPIAICLAVLHLPAVLMATLIVSLCIVAAFKLRIARMPAVAAGLVIAAAGLVLATDPQVGTAFAERWTPALTIATAPPHPVSTLPSSLKDEWLIALGFWLLGNGPGTDAAAALETGVLGLFSVSLLAVGVWTSFARVLKRGAGDEFNDARFTLLAGPAAYLAYATAASPISDMATLNTWTVLIASMIALTPPFTWRARAGATSAEAASPAEAQPNFVQPPQSFPSMAR
jgi:hypothetical protein